MSDRRQQIVDAALVVAQSRGLGAMSMRAVADEMSCSVMALYRHVAGKDDLLDALVGRILAEIPMPDPEQAWEQRLAHLAREVFALAHRYPTVVPLLLTRDYVAPDAVRVVNATSTIVRDAGVPAPDAPRIERMTSTFLLGYSISAANRAFWSDPAATDPPQSGDRGTASPNVWQAELDNDIADLIRLVHQVTATPGH